jgi:hypothetical protein
MMTDVFLRTDDGQLTELDLRRLQIKPEDRLLVQLNVDQRPDPVTMDNIQAVFAQWAGIDKSRVMVIANTNNNVAISVLRPEA